MADQHAQMFAGTIRSNLTLARPDATDDELVAALRTARLDAWVDGLPDGLETPVGEGGVALSGGERRRLAVARALLATGRVIVLDEPTSGLDAPLAGEVVDGVLAAAARWAERGRDHPPPRRGGALRRQDRPRSGPGRARVGRPLGPADPVPAAAGRAGAAAAQETQEQ